MAEAAVPLLVAADGAQEGDPPEGRPVDIAEIEFTVRALPEKKTTQTHLSAGADDQVRIRNVVGVHVAADLLRGNGCGNCFQGNSLLLLLCQELLESIGNLLASTVGDRYVEKKTIVASSGVFGLPDGVL